MSPMRRRPLHVALVHYPVLGRDGGLVTSTITNFGRSRYFAKCAGLRC